jgi:hypothetical protein
MPNPDHIDHSAPATVSHHPDWMISRTSPLLEPFHPDRMMQAIER